MPAGALVIIPTYNERDNVETVAREIFAACDEVDVLFVDDNSPDGTGQILDQMVARDARVQVLHRPGKMGLGTAYRAGFRRGLAAPYERFIEMDADLSHDPRYLPEMLRRSRSGVDLVIGSRYVTGGGTINWGVGRQLISRGGGFYARTVLGLPIRDVTAGFLCFHRRVLETIDLDDVRSEGYGFQIEMKYRVSRAGFKIEEMPIVFVDRRVGQSKMSKKIFLEALTMVWRLRLR
jgi:dolichol-phosphate mannosyltransferase